MKIKLRFTANETQSGENERIGTLSTFGNSNKKHKDFQYTCLDCGNQILRSDFILLRARRCERCRQISTIKQPVLVAEIPHKKIKLAPCSRCARAWSAERMQGSFCVHCANRNELPTIAPALLLVSTLGNFIAGGAGK